jgi:hypothetical protein
VSHIPQVSPGGPGRPQPPADEQKPVGKTSEEFTRLIEKVDESDAQKQGKRRGRPKLEEEPETAEEAPAFSAQAAAPPVAGTLNLPGSAVFAVEGGTEGIQGLEVSSAAAVPTAPEIIESWQAEESTAPSPTPSSTTPPAEQASTQTSPRAEPEPAVQRTPQGEVKRTRVQPTEPSATAAEPKKTARKGQKPVGAKPASAAAQKREKAPTPSEKPTASKRRSKAKTSTAAPASKPEVATERRRRARAQEEAAEQSLVPGLPFLAEAALHHIRTVPTAHGSAIPALSGRPLPTPQARSVEAIGAASAAIGPSLSRSQGVERVIAALKAAVLTLQEQSDKRTLSITLKGDPRLAGTALDGLKIVVEEFAAAPRQYNITLQSAPEAQALLSGAAASMAEQLNRFGKERGWSVQRLDVQVGRPLFHRKEAGDLGQGSGGRGGKTK